MDELLVKWVRDQKDNAGFSLLTKIIGDKYKVIRDSALLQGDTEFKKGQTDALKWVLSLPDEIIKQSTDPDTLEPRS